MRVQKRLCAIHDISCFGRCSLTVALPIISAAGIETTVIPTAVLSTHTGGFSDFTYRDLTGDILPIVQHWIKEGIDFDAIYTGFLGSFEQIDIVCEVIRLLRKKGTLVIVDPVMADGGKLYSLFSADFPSGMKKLCAVADIIVPNITEASLLTGLPYIDGVITKEQQLEMLKALVKLGPKQAVLTGVFHDPQTIGAACYDASSDTYAFCGEQLVGGMYHGTGDVFSSVLSSALVEGCTLQQACKAAVRFTVESIVRTKEAETDNRYGVNFEAGLGNLSRLIADK